MDSGYYDSERHSHDEAIELPCDRCGKWKWVSDLFDGSRWIKPNSAFPLAIRICKTCKAHCEDEAEMQRKENEDYERTILSIETINN